MGKYPNVNKILKITQIDSKNMSLSDDSKWQFLPTMSPPASWKVGDQIRPEEMASFKSEVLYAIIGVTNKDTNTQAQYIGGARGEASDINVTKSMTDTEYPESHLEKEWKIRKAAGNLIVLEDDSVWELTAQLSFPQNRHAVDNWQPEEHYAMIYRTGSKSKPIGKSFAMRNYEVRNVQTGVALVGIFKGWER